MTPILFFDTETTGLPDWKVPSDSEHQPHLVQLAAILADADSRQELATLDLVIAPDGWEIPDEVAEIHGITTEHAAAVGVSESTAVNLLFELWAGHRRVAHNRTFDQRILRIAAKRYLSEGDVEAWADKDAFDDTMLLAKPIMELPPKGKYGWKSPKLSEAYEHFIGKPLENAHSAMADARACMEVYWALLDHQAKAA
ncbi:3'-5' exonuclease [Halomonas salifodinae]|uniref:3'-5' exonuclease n=1 Tax=Halomonas salifodinae TaxID=438745 RepID=A0ABW2EYI8_9GAMM